MKLCLQHMKNCRSIGTDNSSESVPACDAPTLIKDNDRKQEKIVSLEKSYMIGSNGNIVFDGAGQKLSEEKIKSLTMYRSSSRDQKSVSPQEVCRNELSIVMKNTLATHRKKRVKKLPGRKESSIHNRRGWLMRRREGTKKYSVDNTNMQDSIRRNMVVSNKKCKDSSKNQENIFSKRFSLPCPNRSSFGDQATNVARRLSFPYSNQFTHGSRCSTRRRSSGTRLTIASAFGDCFTSNEKEKECDDGLESQIEKVQRWYEMIDDGDDALDDDDYEAFSNHNHGLDMEQQPSTVSNESIRKPSLSKEEEEASIALHLACWSDAPVEYVESIILSYPHIANDRSIDHKGRSPLDIVKEQARCCMCGCCNYNRRKVITALEQTKDHRFDGNVKSRPVQQCYGSSILIHQLAKTTGKTISRKLDHSSGKNGHVLPRVLLTEEALAQRDQLEKQLLFEREVLWMKYGNEVKQLEEMQIQLHDKEFDAIQVLDEKMKEIEELKNRMNLIKNKKKKDIKRWLRLVGKIHESECNLEAQIGIAILDKANLEKNILFLKEQQLMMGKRRDSLIRSIDWRIAQVLGDS